MEERRGGGGLDGGRDLGEDGGERVDAQGGESDLNEPCELRARRTPRQTIPRNTRSLDVAASDLRDALPVGVGSAAASAVGRDHDTLTVAVERLKRRQRANQRSLSLIHSGRCRTNERCIARMLAYQYKI